MYIFERIVGFLFLLLAFITGVALTCGSAVLAGGYVYERAADSFSEYVEVNAVTATPTVESCEISESEGTEASGCAYEAQVSFVDGLGNQILQRADFGEFIDAEEEVTVWQDADNVLTGKNPYFLGLAWFEAPAAVLAALAVSAFVFYASSSVVWRFFRFINW